MSFKLISRAIESNELSLVEDLINVDVDVPYTHLTYETKDKLYEGKLIPNKYFTYLGFIEAISENLSKLQFVDGRAVYHLLSIDLVEVPKSYDIDALLKTIDEQKKEIDTLRHVISTGQLFDVRVLDQYTLTDIIINERIIDGIKYNLYNINREFKLNRYARKLYEKNIEFLGHAGILAVPFSLCGCGSPVISAYITHNKLITFTLRGTLVLECRHLVNQNMMSMVSWNKPINQPPVYHYSGVTEFVKWFMMNIHVLYRRSIRYVYSGTADLRVYVSVDRVQPDEQIWKVNNGKPFVIYS